MYYHMNIAGLERDLPICPVNDSLSIAGFVIFGDQELTVACARELLKRAPEYDYIITAEAKGIPLAHEMARQAGDKKYILARKAPKLYMRDIFSVSVHSITTAEEQKLLSGRRGRRTNEGQAHPHRGRRDLHRREPEGAGNSGRGSGRHHLRAHGRSG